MSSADGQKFVMKHVFKDVKKQLAGKESGTEMVGLTKENFGVEWKLRLVKTIFSGCEYIDFHLDCLHTNQSCNWSIETTFDAFANCKKIKQTKKLVFSENCRSNDNSTDIEISKLEDFSTNNSMFVEFHVTIKKMTGFEKKKLRDFDDDSAKEHSDVLLKVGDQQFYVCKMYLSLHSSYFKTLFNGNFSESVKSEIELEEIDGEDLQNFLELIYGVSLIDDNTITGILKLADYFQATIAIQRCEEFLLKESKRSLKFRFQAALKYDLSKLKDKCMMEMTSVSEFKDLSPENASDYSQDVWKELYDNAMSKF